MQGNNYGLKKREMRKIYIILVLFVLSSCLSSKEKKTGFCRYVDPFVGTAYTGHTFPGAAYPFGFMQPGPQTGNFDWAYCSGYNYGDSLIWGFTQNRINGAGCMDLGDVLIMPFSGVPRKDFKSSFSKKTEEASPGYYKVRLIDNSVETELTCTSHVAIYRYKFFSDRPSVYIDFQNGSVGSEAQYNSRVLSSDIKVEGKSTITGSMEVNNWVRRRLFFVIRFNQPFLSKEVVGESNLQSIFRFDSDSQKELELKVAFSTVSVAGAEKNMEAELNHWDFDKVKKDAENEWEKYLSRVEIEGSEYQKKNFYTSMYHLFIQPNNIADTDGHYRGANDSVFVSPSGKYYSTLSLWDTFRAAHPMYTILTPELVPDMVNSMLLHAETQGFLPIWTLWGKENYCMIANHSVSVVVEACMKNFPGIDPERVYRLVKKSLTENHFNSEWDIYDRYGYFPFDSIKVESVSKTLECGYDNYCAARLAEKLGKKEDARFFMKRAAYYKNVFDPSTKLMRGKDSKGRWRTPFDKFRLSHAGTSGGDYTEGNAWQYTWHVQQDIPGLVKLMGGKKEFLIKLDSLFTVNTRAASSGFVGDVTGLIGQYAHGNEPSHHVVYLYSLLGENWRTAELVREVFDKFYKPFPDGLCGNDDCGQMSAWYLFGALGFYPVSPVDGEFVLGAPQIPKATVNLKNGKKFVMIAHNWSESNKYVRSVKWNGLEIKNNEISYGRIMQGGVLLFEMTDKPVK